MARSERYYMADIERELGVHRSTIRSWESWKSFPRVLAFHRNEKGWRYWTPAQLSKAKTWMASRNPGRVRRHDPA